MDQFRQWQAARAATRREASAAADGRQVAAATADSDGTPMGVDEAIVPTAGASSAQARTAAAAAGATPPTDYALPRPPNFPPPAANEQELRQQVAALLAAGDESTRHAVTFAREVFRQLGEGHLDPPNSRGGHSGDSALMTAQLPAQLQVTLPHTQPSLPLAAVTYQRRCFCCDEEVGEGAIEQCEALRVLGTLREEWERQHEIIDHELSGEVDSREDADIESLHRAARKHMYRVFVAARYGHLGHGNRIRIPDCVVAAIRHQFRAPGCNCELEDLAVCETHGYVGYKER